MSARGALAAQMGRSRRRDDAAGTGQGVAVGVAAEVERRSRAVAVGRQLPVGEGHRGRAVGVDPPGTSAGTRADRADVVECGRGLALHAVGDHRRAVLGRRRTVVDGARIHQIQAV